MQTTASRGSIIQIFKEDAGYQDPEFIWGG